MQARILHHLFRVVGMNVIKAPLWDVSAQGASAFPSNTAYVEHQVSQLLTSSFPNMQPQQVEVGLILSSLYLASSLILHLWPLSWVHALFGLFLEPFYQSSTYSRLKRTLAGLERA